MATAMTSTQWELCLGFIFTQTESWPLWPGQALRRTKTGKGQYGKRRSNKMRGTVKEGSLMGAVLEGSLACWVARPLAIHQPGKKLPLLTWIIPPPSPSTAVIKWPQPSNGQGAILWIWERGDSAHHSFLCIIHWSTNQPTNQLPILPLLKIKWGEAKIKGVSQIVTIGSFRHAKIS